MAGAHDNDRRERLRAALRANLHRRKMPPPAEDVAGAPGRGDGGPQTGPASAPPSASAPGRHGAG